MASESQDELSVESADTLEDNLATQSSESLDFLKKLPDVSAKITEEKFGDKANDLKEAINKEINSPDANIASIGDFMNVLLSSYYDDLDTCIKLLNAFSDVYHEEILQYAKDLFNTLLILHSNQLDADAINSSTASIENAGSLEEIEKLFSELTGISIPGIESNSGENNTNTDGSPDTGDQSGNETNDGEGDENVSLQQLKEDALREIELAAERVPAEKAADKAVILENAKTMINAAEDADSVSGAKDQAIEDLSELVPDESGVIQESRDNAINELRSIDFSTLNDEQKGKIESIITDAIEKITSDASEEEITAHLESAKTSINDIINEGILDAVKEVAIDGLSKHYQGLTFSIKELEDMAKEEYDSSVVAIEDAKSESEVNDILDSAKRKLTEISNETGDSLTEIKELALKNAKQYFDNVISNDSAVGKLYDYSVERIEASSTAKDILAAETFAKDLASNAGALFDENDQTKVTSILQLLKSITDDTSTTNLIGYLQDKSQTGSLGQSKDCLYDAIAAIESSDLKDYRTQLVSAVKKAAESLSSSNRLSIDKIISEFEKDVQNADMLQAYKLSEKALADLEKLQDDVSEAKQKAYKTLDALLDNIDSKIRQEVQDIIDIAKAKVETADSVDEINNLISDAKKSVNDVKVKYDAEVKLENKKSAAKNQIDALIKNVTDSDLKSALEPIINSAKAEIDRAQSESEISQIISQAKSEIKTATTEFSNDKALTLKKTSMIEKLEALTNGKVLTSKLSDIISDAKVNILNASSSTEVDSIYNDAVSRFQNEYLNGLRTDYSNRLDSLLSGSNMEGTTLQKVEEIVTKAKANINKATNEEVMKNIFTQAESSINSLTSSLNTDLESVKRQTIQELENYTTLNTTSVKKVIAAYTNKIQNATTADQVSMYLAEGKELLQKLNEAAGITNETPSNQALANANTSTTTGTSGIGQKEGAEAMLKNGTETQSGVKTGDENGTSIVVSLLGIVVGMGLLGVVISKIIKQFKNKK